MASEYVLFGDGVDGLNIKSPKHSEAVGSSGHANPNARLVWFVLELAVAPLSLVLG